MRVIAGRARGRTLRAPESDLVRPTGDRVKEALFSQLEALAQQRGFERVIDEADLERFASAQAWPRVLDLYAGSGALGIEALSRGAERADFVESNRAARRIIAENLQRTGLADLATLHPIETDRAVSTLAGSYDLILADPPYGDRQADRAIERIAGSRLVHEQSVLVWEHRADHQAPLVLGRMRLLRSRRHGQTTLSLYTAGGQDEPWREGAEAEQVTS